jgi:hypothetical protein
VAIAPEAVTRGLRKKAGVVDPVSLKFVVAENRPPLFVPTVDDPPPP